MIKHVTLFLIFLISLGSASAQSDNKIIVGKIVQIQSKILGEKRTLWIYTPDLNSSFRDTSKHYPVIYLLDGDTNFESLVGVVKNLSQVNGNSVIPEMIIVGILNTDRARDLTPTHISSDPPYFDSASSVKTGGGQKFISFIEKELIPYIDSSYSTSLIKC
jgi:predicted alpha/beta superfamily hydrolase